MQINWKKLTAAVIICQLAGVIGSAFTIPNIPTWYDLLAKPDFTPSGGFIGLVWVVLYAIMGISLYLVWEKGVVPKTTGPLTAFGIQLLLNASWPFLFFGLRSPLYGLIGISALFLALAYTVARFSEVSKMAAFLLFPYLLWVVFTGYLNFAIWQLN